MSVKTSLFTRRSGRQLLPILCQIALIWLLAGLFTCLANAQTTIEPRSPSPSSSEAVEAKLGTTTSVSYIAQPLTKIIGDLSAKHGIEMRVEESAFENAPDSSDLNTSIMLKDVTLRSALRLMLREHNLSYILRHGELVVTSSEVAELALQDRQYTLPAILSPDSESFLALLNDTILFKNSEAKASIEGSVLFVEAPSEILSLVEQLLQQFGPQDSAKRTSRANTFAKLQQSIDLKYVFTNLTDAVRQISEETQLPILIDRRALEEAGISIDTPVTFQLTGVPIRQSLRFLLHQYDLAYTVNEVVIVMPKSKADGIRQIRVHQMPPAAEPHMAKLRDILLKRSPEVWTAPNTPNRVAFFQNCLVVYGNEDVQNGTEAFVDSMKARFQAYEARVAN